VEICFDSIEEAQYGERRNGETHCLGLTRKKETTNGDGLKSIQQDVNVSVYMHLNSLKVF
jgi:hypothetical protein